MSTGTRTIAVLKLSHRAHMEIRHKMLEAGYGDAIDEDRIDMNGIAIRLEADSISKRQTVREWRNSQKANGHAGAHDNHSAEIPASVEA